MTLESLVPVLSEERCIPALRYYWSSLNPYNTFFSLCLSQHNWYLLLKINECKHMSYTLRDVQKCLEQEVFSVGS